MASKYYVYHVLFLLLCIAGIALSVFAYYVETEKEKDPSFKAFCDFSPRMSCSKVFTSKWGRGFGLLEYVVPRTHWLNQPNSVFGIIFYTLQIILSFAHSLSAAKLQIVFAVLANCGSVYLGYILYFVLEDFCIICVSTYVVNFILLLVSMLKSRQLSHVKMQVSRKKKN